ncbi:ABL069Cp [Eremothecium gossypii ATCC 10895]|uniref:ABL069Cp n=1 Tax=Eremothecium gossypii (strain ATCC 10895 / CBS 109.51 / FGSC 9923 / NRRL Y-1056) TaxID=284811 RepID=Q75DU2_EREGS|nr:ABL069Cp [Eremothecium gossypii ATCC 10895]AAS50702.2 ABL069Cp [Eremothecium gossypii ATCC 10895]AEY94990.1 FABL069Cp [Eremothecium gossypii FDAG1]
MTASEDTKLLASFSPDATRFAFQANASQKNFIDIYPLDPERNYTVNSSSVNRIDFEATDLNLTDVVFQSWCLANSGQDISTKTKRRRGTGEDDEEQELSSTESFLINVFQQGKIVVFSPNGQDILNIIQNKRELLGIDTIGTSLWILDDDKTVKHFTCTSTKPIKTFHLVDGKDEDILDFGLLNFPDVLLISVIVEDIVYIIDPTKRRPSTVAKLEVPGCRTCKVLDDEHVVVAGANSISVIKFKEQSIIHTWELGAKKIDIVDGNIVALGEDGNISVFNAQNPNDVLTVRVENNSIIEFGGIGDRNLVVAWLNVNEPNFEIITSAQLASGQNIVLQQAPQPLLTNHAPDTQVPEQEAAEREKPPSKKTSKTEQDDTSQALIHALATTLDEKVVTELLISNTWSEDRIKEFVHMHLLPSRSNELFVIVSQLLASDVWAESSAIRWWFKWLLRLRAPHLDALQPRGNKEIKALRANLKASSDSLPILLSMQGALEMLRAQAKLRQELSQVALEDADDAEYGSEITYANGEADDFVDALDYKK